MTSEDQAAAADEPAPEDRIACALLADAVKNVLRVCPGVRSVSCALDYEGVRDAATTLRAVWLERPLDPTAESAPGGSRIDAAIGAVQATAHLLRIQADQAEYIAAQLRELVARLGQEAIDARDRLQLAQEEKEDQTTINAASGRPDPGPAA